MSVLEVEQRDRPSANAWSSARTSWHEVLPHEPLLHVRRDVGSPCARTRRTGPMKPRQLQESQLFTEKKVLEVLPERGFVREYVLFAHNERPNGSPLAFHLGTALTVLSVCVAPSASFVGTNPNLYTMLLGDAGLDQKTRALSLGLKVLRGAVQDNRILVSPGSYEGLLDALAKTPQALVAEGELSRFLVQAKNGGFLGALKKGYTDLYDGHDAGRVTAKNTVRVQQPRLSIIGAIAPQPFEEHIEQSDFTDGFLSRWMIMYAHREKSFCVTEEKSVKHLSDSLARRLALCPPGQLGWAPDAEAHYRRMFEEIDKFALEQRGHEMSSLWSRYINLLNKLTMLIAIDDYIDRLPRGMTAPEPFAPGTTSGKVRVSVEHLEIAQKIATAVTVSAVALYRRIDRTPDMRIKRRILNFIKLRGHHGADLGQILREAKSDVLKNKIGAYLETLEEEGLIRKTAEVGARLRYFDATISTYAEEDDYDDVDPPQNVQQAVQNGNWSDDEGWER